MDVVAGLVPTALVVALLLRISIPWEVIDLFWHYSTPGGSLIEKIHPGAYALFFVCIGVYLTRGPVTDPVDRRLAAACWRFILALFAVILLSLATNHIQGVSYLLDSMLLSPLVAMTMLKLNRAEHMRMLVVLVIFMIANDFVSFFEYATHDRLFPYQYALNESAAVFRPAALLGHPLVNGLLNALLIPLVWLLPTTLVRRIALVFFFLAASFAAGARIASLIGFVCALLSAWMYLWQSAKQRRIDEGVMVVSAILTIGVIVLAALLIVTSGLADRLIQNGLEFQDASSRSRFDVFRILGFLSRQQLLFGVSREWSAYLMTKQLNLQAIENPVLAFVIGFGLIGTLILLAGLASYLWRLGRSGGGNFVALSVIAFIGIELTSISIAAKGPQMAFIGALYVSARAFVRSRPAPARIRVGRTQTAVAPRQPQLANKQR
jgi:hypothetical protein